MKRTKTSLRDLLSDITPEERAEARLSFQISNRLDFLMKEKGLPKKQLADSPSSAPAGSIPSLYPLLFLRYFPTC